MRTVVTGGTGFIGTRLALRCAELGETVTVLGQENTAAERDNRALLARSGVEVAIGSVEERDKLAAILAGADVVYHLAAAQHEANVPDAHFHAVNVEGTRNVLEAAVAGGVGRFVHGSTIGVYGALDGVIDETTPTCPDNVYGVTKLEGEAVARGFAGRLEVAIVRISETYGPGDRRLLKLFRAIDKGVFFMVGSGANVHHLIYVDDLVAGLRAAARSPEAVGEVFVLAGKEAVTTDAMVRHITAALGARGPRFRAPLWPFLAAAVTLEFTLRPLGIQPPLHRRRMDFFRKSFEFSPDRTSRLLHFNPEVDFAQGAALTARWYRDQGLV